MNKKSRIHNKVNELLVQELDVKESELNKFITNKSLSLILGNLSKNRRLEFYKLLNSNNLYLAKLLIQKDIPNFNYVLFSEIKKELKQII